jgi:hypothetical protein
VRIRKLDGRQLERQGDAVQPPAQLRHGRGVGRCQREPRSHRHRTADEKLHRRRLSNHLCIGNPGGGRVKRFQRDLALLPQAQGATAGDQYGQLGAGGEEPS